MNRKAPNPSSPASWPEETVGSFDEFEQLVRPRVQEGHGPFKKHAFRGQSTLGWSLRPTLTRELTEYERRAAIVHIASSNPVWRPS